MIHEFIPVHYERKSPIILENNAKGENLVADRPIKNII